MLISSKGLYALEIMIFPAQRRSMGAVSLKDISECCGISKKYLEQIAAALRKTDKIKALKGHKGGYMLTKSAEEYSIGEILAAAGDVEVVSGTKKLEAVCSDENERFYAYVWSELDKTINEYLRGISLREIADEKLRACSH